METMRRRVILRLGSDDAPPPGLAALTVGEKLVALQQLVHALGAGMLPVKGKAKTDLKDQLGLVLVKVSTPESEVALELPEFQPSLFAREDVGLKVLERLASTLAWIAERDLSELEHLHPDPATRRRVFRAARALAPGPDDPYRVGIATALGEVELGAHAGRFLDPLLAD